MKNPLRKRLLRELRQEMGKYLVVFILMVATIGFVSGFLVADGSMLIAYDNSFEKYNIEDGNFATEEKVYKNQQETIEGYGVKLYENFYVEKALSNGSTLRIFKNREEVNKVCLMKGKMPKEIGEIAIDRMYLKDEKADLQADSKVAADVYISSAYADKFSLQPGDMITLKEKYEKDKYTFRVKGIYEYNGGLCIFMNQNQLNRIFDLGSDYYSGYFSDTKITDINSKYIGSVIDLDALTKISRQLDVSMGNMMGLINGFAIAIFLVLIYLLSKIIIEKNAQSISMVKILGYSNGEISRLYILSTSLVVVLCLLLSFPVETILMKGIFREMMLQSLSGWIALYIDPKIYVKMFVIGLVTYAVVALLEYRKIQKVPMDEALKNVE